jgi:2-amino-4-hydroxy-6-hydroxymethyldihydropteridine diphosphokinase
MIRHRDENRVGAVAQVPVKTEVFIGIGSNLSDPIRQIQTAIVALKESLDDLVQAQLYRSKPLGPQDQPDFINTAVRGFTHLTADALLNLCQQIETNQQRVRTQHWGPRTVDLDILYYGAQRITTEVLVVPHPEIMHRTFVTKPLLDLLPQGTMPTGEYIDASGYDFSELTRIEP